MFFQDGEKLGMVDRDYDGPQTLSGIVLLIVSLWISGFWWLAHVDGHSHANGIGTRYAH